MKKAILFLLVFSIIHPFFGQPKIIFPSHEQAEKIHLDRWKEYEIVFDNNEPYNYHASNLESDNIRSRNGKTERLDSLVEFGFDLTGHWKAIYSTGFAYNENQLIESAESFDSYFTEVMKPNDRVEYFYNAVAQCTSYYSKYWNDEAGYWINSSRSLFQYNNIGRLVEEWISHWNEETESWDDFYKEITTYSPEDLIIEKVIHGVNYLTSQFEERNKTSYTYNDDRELILKETFTKEPGLSEWKLSNKTEYDYENRREIQRLLYRMQVNQLELYLRVLQKYDANGNLINVKGQVPAGSIWIPEYEYWFTYDDRNRAVVYEDNENWDFYTHEWLHQYKSTRIYSDYDDIIQENSYTWDDTSKIWLDVDQARAHYDINLDVADIALPRVPQITNEDYLNTHRKLLGISFSSFDPEYNQWHLSDSFSLIYSIIIAAEDIHLSPALIYPNPATDQIMIEFNDIKSKAELEIYTLHGQLMLKTSIQTGQSISLKQVVDGIHFYKIHTGQTTYTGKLVVQH